MDFVTLKIINVLVVLNHGISVIIFFFFQGSVQTSVNIGWHGGVHVQSCRHYIHLSCHESYIKSLQVIIRNIATPKKHF